MLASVHSSANVDDRQIQEVKKGLNSRQSTLQMCDAQVVYVGADDIDTIAKLEKANRAGAAAAITAFACQPGCRRKYMLNYFGDKR